MTSEIRKGFNAISRSDVAQPRQMPASPDTFLAMNSAIDKHVTADMGTSADLQIAFAKNVPGGTQVAVTDNRALGGNSPAGSDGVASLYVAIAPDRPASVQILPRLNKRTGTDAATNLYRPTGSHNRGNVYARAHFQRAGKHDSIRFYSVHTQYGVRRSKLFKQPQSIIDPSMGNERVQQSLVIAAILMVT